MLEQIQGLPAEIWGVRAKGRVSKEDYDEVVVPALDRASQEGQRIRLLYELGPEFESFSPAAAWEDLRVGAHYQRLFDRCAVVTDHDWFTNATNAISAVAPCPTRVFKLANFAQAVEWLTAPIATSLEHHLLPARGVLVIEPRDRLKPEDFDALQATADTWIDSNGALNGIVVHATEFPGWEDFSGFLRHLNFVRDHHQDVRRVALAVDGKFASLAQALGKHFISAEIKQFKPAQLNDAIAWAAGEAPPQLVAGHHDGAQEVQRR
jgi:hypothetical protein